MASVPGRDPRRRFAGGQRRALLIAAGGRCAWCGFPLPASFHADHEHPHSAGGRTDVRNGQALCASCNQHKSDRLTCPSAGHLTVTSPAEAGPRDGIEHPVMTGDPADADKPTVTHTEEISTMHEHPKSTPPVPAMDISSRAARRPTSEPPSLRAWQRRAVPLILAHDQQPFLLEACPGAGKTIPALTVTRSLLEAGRVARLVVVCPTTNLARQWAAEAARFGLRVEPNWNGNVLPADCHGIAVTYQRVAACPDLYRHLTKISTLVIADEPHHMGDRAAWGQAFRHAFEHAHRWLLLSGTAFRSDNQPIPGVRYDNDGTSQPDFTYSYAQAVSDGVCRKIAFVPFDGDLTWSDQGTVMQATFADHLDGRQAAYRLRTSLSPGMNEGLGRMIEDADRQLTAVRQDGHEDAGGLIVACDITHARKIAGVINRVCSEPAMIVVSDDPSASRQLDRFRRGRQRWVVAVNMISEGVDIPRLRVGVYATVARTPLLFRQIIGRFVRVIRGLPADPSYLLLPADPTLRALAAEIEAQLRHQLTDTEPEQADRDRPAEDEEEPQVRFEPLDAHVHAQTTLMSGLEFSNPQQAAAIHTLARELGISPEDVHERVLAGAQPVSPDVPGETDFQRRERLRALRKRLVGRLHFQAGREYSEINAWLNDAVARGTPVSQHTISELEQAVRMLTAEIAGARQHAA